MKVNICAIIPHNEIGNNNKIFEINPMFMGIKRVLEKRGWKVATYDTLKGCDINLLLVFSCSAKAISQSQTVTCKKVYFAYEPEVVTNLHSKKNIDLLRPYFSAVVTHFDNLVNNEWIFKCAEGKNTSEVIDDVSWDDKKLLCNVSGYKTSRHPLELYSLRRKVIDYFRDNKDFDFFGQGNWEELGYDNYCGKLGDKLTAYHRYKFALCVENARDLDGYITEKIIDCFCAGIVPIYYGGENVSKYIPDDCYIHMEKYENDLDELYSLLKNMNYSQWKQYVDKGKNYLRSVGKDTFSYERYEENFENLFEKIYDNLIIMKASIVKKMIVYIKVFIAKRV